jgi:hypothetical protein
MIRTLYKIVFLTYFKLLQFMEFFLQKFPNNSYLRFFYAKYITLKNKHIYNSSWSYMEDMYKDSKRNEFYKKLIKKYAPNEELLEIGSGLGYLTVCILKEKPKKLTVIEASDSMYRSTHSLISKNIDKTDHVKLINKSTYELKVDEIPSSTNYILHELIGHNIFSESFIETINNIKHILPKARMLPGKIRIYCQPVYMHQENQFKFLRNKDFQIDMSPVLGFNHNAMRFYRGELVSIEYDPFIIFDLDFNIKMKTEDKSVIDLKKFPRANAIIIFFNLSEKELSYSNSPFVDIESLSHWWPMIYQYSNNSNHSLELSYDRTKFNIKAI